MAHLVASKGKDVTLIGADVFLRAGEIPQAPESCGPLRLEWIANRGTKIWPGEPPDIMLVDLFRCRYLAAEGAVVTSADIRALLEALENPSWHWVHVEKLILIDGEPAFSAG